MMIRCCALFILACSIACAGPPCLSGIHPHLAFFNDEGECGTGAIVPWAGRLWAITYAPHKPLGSSDKLYSITPELEMTIHPESIGGTPASRMIHKESGQLFIGPYAIDKVGKVRAIPYSEMFGRHTGLARHLADPASKIVSATMEEGIYEIEVKTLSVRELWGDEAAKNSPRKADLPGYHGKGFYSGQGVYVYSNNGDHAKEARSNPTVPSGVLAEWDGKADAWTIVRRNQFTEVTGPGGIYGNENPATDPIWALGWDSKSLLLGVRDAKTGWSFFRLPKGSHSYDGAHGWNTEWPRIRDIGEDDFLMTMHGTFWEFPKTFAAAANKGIRPRSTYLKVIGDFCRWNDKIVFGCDDTARNEFLNKRKAKGEIAAPQSQSNLWFVDKSQLDTFGPAIGRGAVWVDEPVKKGAPSDAYLFSGYARRALHLTHSAGEKVTFRIETDRKGNGEWTPLAEVDVPASGYLFVPFAESQLGAWVRVTSTADLEKASAVFTYHNPDARSTEADPIFNGLAKPGETHTKGFVQALGANGTLAFEAHSDTGTALGTYELAADLDFRRFGSITTGLVRIPAGILTVDAASVLYVDDNGKRWRLPKGDPALDKHVYRVCREVATERDLLNAHGTFYELPANNAGGIAKLRPVATHNRLVHDYCSYRGLFVVSGVVEKVPTDNPHIILSADGKAALWAGAIDDIWKLGKPRGQGGPWRQTPVKAGEPSDPYLMTGYDRKSLLLTSSSPATITAEIDISGTGHWVAYQAFKVDGKTEHAFPESFQAYWIRFSCDRDTAATATLIYN